MFRAELFRSGVDVKRPFDAIVHSHDELVPALSDLLELAKLPPGMRRGDLVKLSRRIDALVLDHHQEEERELFPAVAAAARGGQRQTMAQLLAARLVEDHRRIETLWCKLRPMLLGGAPATTETAERLVAAYRAHATFEEERYLPFARRVMAREGNHLAAFGLALHLHRLPPLPAFI
jgi:hypothetical protein